jgi:HEAT repeat protein
MPLFPEFESLAEGDLRSLLLGEPSEGPAYARAYFGELASRIAVSPEGLEFLHKLAAESSEQRLAGIIDGLADVSDRIGLGALLTETISSEDEYVLIATLDAARFVRLAMPVNRERELFGAPSSDFVLAAVHRYLARMNPEDVITELVSALSHQSPIVRGNAIDELADLDYKAAAPAITRLLTDPDPQVCEAAESALTSLA